MMWQAKLKAWAVGLGLTAATIGGTGYLATTGVGQGPPVPGLGGPASAKSEQPLTKGSDRPEPFPPAKGDPDYAESLQFDIDRAKLQIERADVAIKLDKMMQSAGPAVTLSDRYPSSIAALQAKEDKLVAERNLKLAERRLAIVKGQPVAAAVPAMSAELRKLREQRVEVLTKGLKNLDGRRGGGLFGQESAPDYIDFSEKLAEAEMILAATNEQKIAFWAKHRDRMKEFHLYFKSRSVSGTVIEATVHQAREAELAAEIRLLELGAK